VIRLRLLFACLLWMPVAAAEDDTLPSLSVGGLLFGDLYYVPTHHSDDGDGAVGAVIRRGYLTFDADFSENWFGRMRFELNQSGELETYDFEVSFKDLYLGWNLGRQQLLLGLSPTPTFDLIESIWSFRYLARTPMDLQGVASRDNGISLKGPLNASGTFGYRAMFGAEADFGNEFVGYKTDTLSWGAQYSHQDREDDPTLELASAFVWNRVGKKTRLVGRVDRLIKPSPRGNNIAYLPFDPTAPATMFIGGLEFQPSPHFFLTPNFVWTRYDRNDEGVRPSTDFHLRLTLFINFE